jgi:hypothetical protein
VLTVFIVFSIAFTVHFIAPVSEICHIGKVVTVLN